MLQITGYPDRYSVAAGERIAFKISLEDADRFHSRIVRVVHGDCNPEGPGLKLIHVPTALDGRHPGRKQLSDAGSYMVVADAPDLGARAFTVLATVWPTLVEAAAVLDPPDPPPADDSTEAILPHFKDARFWLSGQSNFVFQTHPDFHALYSGPQSLGANYEKATSRVMTLYTGVRLNNSTELLVDIEEAGGAALTTGLGLAGNTDLDIVRNPLLSKAPYLGRGMIHKVFALSKDKIENQRNAFSLFDELPRRRFELRFGKFSLPDFFVIRIR